MAASQDDGVYEKTKLNAIGRHKERGHYDKESISKIINEAKILHLSFIDGEDLPQCVPMLGAWEEDETGQVYIYFHGWRGRWYNLLADSGTPVCATATILDGYVLALATFSHSMNYRSAVLHGVTYPFPDDDKEAKMHAFKLVVESAAPGRWDHARQPDDSEVKQTGIIRMKVESASAKIRTGGPKDSTKDTESDLTKTVWSGVLPVHKEAGEPIRSEYNMFEGPVPDHVKELL